MRDGVKLYTAVYSPKDKTQKYPIMIMRTPYSLAPYGKDKYFEHLGPSQLFTEEKYIFVYQDVRGQFMSEGEFDNMRPYIPNKKSNKDIDESSDIYDTIDWLVKNISGNNGNVGMWGISYPGFYAAMACIDAHPSLKAVSPQAPISDWFVGDDFHHNGALFLADAFHFFSVFGVHRDTLTKTWPKGYGPDSVKDGYKFYLDLGPIKNINERYYKNRVKFWNEAVSHPDYDEYWKSRNTLQYFKNIKPAVLITGGWFDAEDLYGSVNTYKTMEKNSPEGNIFYAMGPWFHGGWARSTGEQLGAVEFGSKTSVYYLEQIELNFFNYYLKGKGSPPSSKINIFETGSNTWNKYTSWPPQNIKEEHLYFDSNKLLSFTKPTISENSYFEYISDPSNPVPYTSVKVYDTSREFMIEDQRFVSSRNDVLTCSTGILDSDVTLAGPVKTDFYLSTSGTDADWVVKLIDVFPDTAKGKMSGYQMLVRWEVMRGKYRNSYEKPEPFKPNEITHLNFTLPDVSHSFRKGHKIMVQIQSSMFPMVDRNPGTFTNIYTCDDSVFITTKNRIYYSKKYPSSLIINTK